MRMLRHLAVAMLVLFPFGASASGTLLTLTVGEDVREFDRDALEAMGVDTIRTSTIWTEGVQEFIGVSLLRFLEANGLEGSVLKATAINDYVAEIPTEDAVEGGPIIAFLRNGEAMSVRDKGPLWIVYPFDSNPDYQSETIYSRSIWQLDRIEVVP